MWEGFQAFNECQISENHRCPEEVEKFPTAFSVGCFACGVDTSLLDAIQARGWKIGTNYLTTELRSKGLSDFQIIDELISIYEAAFSLAPDSSSS